MRYGISLAALLLLSPLAVGAQAVDPAPPTESAKHVAVDAQEKPVTEALNEEAAVEASGNRAAVQAVNRANEAQLEADMAAYRAQVQANRQEMLADEARYERQQRAYANAMAVWRDQKDACDRGVLKECKKPTPNPADFYGY